MNRLLSFCSLVATLALITSSGFADIVTDGSFETPQQATNGYYYRPTGYSFDFNSTSGVIQAPSAFGGPTTGFTGTQYSFLQTNTAEASSGGVGGSITQTITLPSDGVFKFSDVTARRDALGSPTAQYEVQLDGQTISPTLFTSANSFARTEFTFSGTAGSHVLSLVSTGGTDSTSFVDDISISAFTGGFVTRAFAGDVDSGISIDKFYTHAVNIGGGPLTINSVDFVGGNQSGVGTALPGAATYTFAGAGNGPFVNFDNGLTGDINALARDFIYGGNQNDP